MAYKVIILYQLYMPSYFLGTFTEYPYEYSPQGMTGLVNYFFEHDQYELPADYTVSDRPPLPMPAQVK